MNYWNLWVYSIERERLIHRLSRRAKGMRDTIVTVNTVHSKFFCFGDLIWRQWVFHIGVDCVITLRIDNLDPWNILLQWIECDEIHLILNVPMNPETLAFTLYTAARFHDEIGGSKGIVTIVAIVLNRDNFVIRELFGPMAFLA